MHFKSTVTMDMAESFRQADVSKTDFFELVTSPELTDAQFKQQMRAVNVFLDAAGGGNPLLSGEPGPPAPLQSFDSIWNQDRERERLESAVLEDLDEYYWGQDAPRDTDGHIYTLTVLQGDAWPRRPAPPALDLDAILDIAPAPAPFEPFPPDEPFREEPDNNNDWKLADRNGAVAGATPGATPGAAPGGGSLLRSALQGRAARYPAPEPPPPAPAPPVPPAEPEPDLLAQLDAHYADNFEKLDRIASEVAESVSQFCGERYGLGLAALLPEAAPQPAAPPKPKKYKRTPARPPPGPPPAGPSGPRKERSLHYCSICSKGFKDKYSVNVHIRTHTGEKPFACSLCGKSFRQKAHLAKHYQTHLAQKSAAAAGAVKAAKQR